MSKRGGERDEQMGNEEESGWGDARVLDNNQLLASTDVRKQRRRRKDRYSCPATINKSSKVRIKKSGDVPRESKRLLVVHSPNAMSVE